MGTCFKTKKLSVLALLAGLTYAFLIVNTFASEWDEWQMSFNKKALGAEYNKWGDVIGHQPVESYSFPIKSKNGFTSFPDSLVNQVNHQTIKAKYNRVIVIAPPSNPVISPWVNVMMTVLAFILLIVVIRIPIHFYKLLGLIKKEFIFERLSIYLLRWLGFELLIVYFGMLLMIKMSHQIDCSMFSFSEYEIVMDSMDPIWLLLGIIVLMIAEILSKGLSIRTEQELTI
jgi:hypothetical protein